MKNKEALSAIKESQHRIHSMSIIHQKLYQSETLSTIHMPEYIYELVEYLRESYGIREKVGFSLQIENIELNHASAITLGLILNEAITNAIKYAFPDGKNGTIEVSFKQKKDDHLVITVKDNGVGMSTVKNTGQNSLGMKLLKGLSEDLDANLTINGEKGTTISVDFINKPDKNGSL